MRTQIKVMDLSVAQWDWLQDNIPDSLDIPENAVRVCVEFELGPAELSPRHIEMPVRAFVALMSQLQEIQRLYRAALANHPSRTGSPAASMANFRAAQPTCDHGSPVVEETPSVFEGADPVRTYEDGCSSVGPYQPLSDTTFHLDK